MRPVVNGLKQRYGDRVRFADLDFNNKNNHDLVEKFRIIGHPSFVLADGQGNLVKRWIGIVQESDFEDALTQILK